ncbi:hypothetical protein FXF51_51605 [Nonomuraea sp. PA05]|uniref:hypothetical protein n=1 Tax=Nonomuraea sp. PA05 TaxID=2604466 RepID=UPI0011D4B545|nr:hypothetical protein [Nonomuraea sp. PA05]TYB52380.1 hypothetical protein FXF51_51605 [Nonomuraea sp. PA05]
MKEHESGGLVIDDEHLLPLPPRPFCDDSLPVDRIAHSGDLDAGHPLREEDHSGTPLVEEVPTFVPPSNGEPSVGRRVVRHRHRLSVFVYQSSDFVYELAGTCTLLSSVMRELGR